MAQDMSDYSNPLNPYLCEEMQHICTDCHQLIVAPISTSSEKPFLGDGLFSRKTKVRFAEESTSLQPNKPVKS